MYYSSTSRGPAPQTTNTGLIRAAYDRELNIIAITTADVEGDFSILLNEKMIDFSQPVVISVNGEETTLNIVPDLKTLYETTYMRGDPNYQFEAEVSIRVRR